MQTDGNLTIRSKQSGNDSDVVTCGLWFFLENDFFFKTVYYNPTHDSKDMFVSANGNVSILSNDTEQQWTC